jgi:hypothetical protein
MISDYNIVVNFFKALKTLFLVDIKRYPIILIIYTEDHQF